MKRARLTLLRSRDHRDGIIQHRTGARCLMARNKLTGRNVGDLSLQPMLAGRLAAYPDLNSLVLVDAQGREAHSVAPPRPSSSKTT